MALRLAQLMAELGDHMEIKRGVRPKAAFQGGYRPAVRGHVGDCFCRVDVSTLFRQPHKVICEQERCYVLGPIGKRPICLHHAADDVEYGIGVLRLSVGRYKRQLPELLGHKPAVAQAGTGQQVDTNMRSQIRVLRMRAEELRTTAEQFEVPSAQDSLRSAARNYDLMADNLEALLSIQPTVEDAKAS